MRRLLAVVVLLFAAALAGAGEAGLDPARVAAMAEALSAIPDRAQGRPGAASAAALIERELRAAGVARVLRVRHGMLIPVDHGSHLELADGRRLALTPAAPNLGATPGTRGRTLRGPLFDGGTGSMAELAGCPPGAIVVLRPAAGQALGWGPAAQVGAAAVLWTHDPEATQDQVTVMATGNSVEFPRFVLPPLADGATLGGAVALTARVTYEPAEAVSVIAIIPGSARADQAVLLTAGYEANGPLPTQGALRAWNAAMLLETVRGLAAAPPRRTVVAVFHGARGDAMRGLRDIAGALMTDRRGDALPAPAEDRLRQYAAHARTQADAGRLAAEAFAQAGDDHGEALRARWAAAMAPAVARLGSADGAQALVSADKTRLDQFPSRMLALAASDFGDRRQRELDALRDRVRPRGASRAISPAGQAELDASQQEQIAWRSLQLKLESGVDLTAEEAVRARSLAATGAILARAHAAHHGDRADRFADLLALRTALAATAPVQLLAYEFSDGHRRWAGLASGPFQGGSREMPLIHGVVREVIDRVRRTRAEAGCDTRPYDRPADIDGWWQPQWMHEAGMVGQYLWAVSLATHSDQRPRSGMPGDRFAALDRAALAAQLPGVAEFVRQWVDLPLWDDRRRWRARMQAGDFKPLTLTIRQRAVGTKSGERGSPFASAFLLYAPTGTWAGDLRGVETRRADVFGIEPIAFMPAKRLDGVDTKIAVRTYRYADDGGITGVLRHPDRQKPAEEVRFDLKDGTQNLAVTLFDAVPSRAHGLFEPRMLVGLPIVRALSSSREALPQYLRVEVFGQHAAIFTEEHRLRLVAGINRLGNSLVMLGATAAGRRGGLDPGQLGGITALDTARSMVWLNDVRMQDHRRHGIDADALVGLHAAAQARLHEAEAAAARGEWAAAEAQAQSAWALSTRVYPRVLATANDVVLGLVLLLLLSLPFAILVERLLVAGDTIGRRVVGFVGVFIVTFAFFYIFHPGFALATTPAIIFLAFLIMLVSGWVIVVVYQRFELEMQLIRRAGTGVQGADVSRLGTLVATVGLGISSMRRRPLRTGLTWLTVCLMTFILLTFASFNPASGFQRVRVDAPTPWQGILVRENGWGPMFEASLPRLRQRWGERAEVVPLRWIQPTERARGTSVTAGTRAVLALGVVGVHHREPSAVAPALRHPGDGATGPARPGVLYLPPLLRSELGVGLGDEVALAGRRLRVGELDPAAWTRARTIGGGALTPLAPDIIENASEDQTRKLETLDPTAPGSDASTPIHLDAETCAVVHESHLAAMGVSLRGVAVIPGPQLAPGVLAEEMALELGRTLRVGEAGETTMVTAVNHLSVSGLAAVLVPLILGGLIIFSTMLNSVAERGREIFTYAALGLAPIHVAALFLVEAGIYAVLGGLGGYILAQLVVAGLGVAAAQGWAAQPDLNYSSFTAVATILLVMATVLVSALYPAWVASRAARPGGGGEFSLPRPEGDVIACPFPFTVPAADAAGLALFLRDHFAGHSESSAGAFTAAEAAATTGEHPQVTARIWLAPFDLGISQRLVLRLHATDMRGVKGVDLRLELLSGQRSDWLRANAAFVKDLRLQFLLWRTLDPAMQERYRARAQAELPP